MTLRHFRIFLAVCERLSMTESASRQSPRPSMKWKTITAYCYSNAWVVIFT